MYLCRNSVPPIIKSDFSFQKSDLESDRFIVESDFGQAIQTIFRPLFSKKSEFRPSLAISDHSLGHWKLLLKNAIRGNDKGVWAGFLKQMLGKKNIHSRGCREKYMYLYAYFYSVIQKLVRAACVHCHGTKCPLSFSFSLLALI